MNPLQNSKMFNALPPVLRDNAAFTGLVIDLNDCAGADYMEFIILTGFTDIAASVLRIMESDTKTDEFTLGGTPTVAKDATVKPGALDDNKVMVIGLNLKVQRKRYLLLEATAGNGTIGTYLAAVAVAMRRDTTETNATNRNLLFADYVNA